MDAPQDEDVIRANATEVEAHGDGIHGDEQEEVVTTIPPQMNRATEDGNLPQPEQPLLSEADISALKNATTVAADADLETFRNRKEECVICIDKMGLAELEQLPCNQHWVCRVVCLPNYFDNAIQTQALYPPRCCERFISIDLFKHLLSADLIARYMDKTQEYYTDPRLRRYCAEDKTFLPPESYEDIGEKKEMTIAWCKTCSKSTCIVCAEIVNTGRPMHDCKWTMFETNSDYTKDTRFKGCPFCGRLGLLENACNHVTCGCGGEYCFICLEPWSRGDGHEECTQYNDPSYDEEGYDAKGFHRDTGFDREGYTRAGYNIRGLNRQGERMKGFATRDSGHKKIQQRHQDEGFLDDLTEEQFDEAITMMIINALERGDVTLAQQLQLRFDRESNREDEADRDDEHQPNDNADGEQDQTQAEEPETEQEQPEPYRPSPEHIACVHVPEFEFNGGDVHCDVCTQDTIVGFFYSCPQCSLKVCGECYHGFVGTGKLGWPGFEETQEARDEEAEVVAVIHPGPGEEPSFSSSSSWIVM